MGDEWGDVAEACCAVASKLSEHMARKALEVHTSLWEGAGAVMQYGQSQAVRVEPSSTDSVRQYGEELQFLDIAAGAGWFSKLLAARLREQGKAFSVHCTDLSPGMLDLARRNITDPGVKFSVMDGQDLSTVEDASLDGVNCLFGIMFLPEYPKCFTEMKRVLKPGAKATVGTWHSAGGLELADAFGVYVGCLSPGEVSKGRMVLATGQDPDDLDKLMLEGGFSDIIVHQEGYNLETTNLEALYEMLMRKPASRTSLISTRHGAPKPSFEAFKDFMAGSLSAAEFRQSDNPGSYVIRFVANIAVGSAQCLEWE